MKTSFTMDEASIILRVGRTSLYGIVRRHPYYYKNGRRLLFTEDDINSIIEALREEGKERDYRKHSSSYDPSRGERYISPDRAYEKALQLIKERQSRPVHTQKRRGRNKNTD